MENAKELKTFVEKLKNYENFLSKIKEIKYIYNYRWNVLLKNDQLIKFGQYNFEEQFNYLKFIKL